MKAKLRAPSPSMIVAMLALFIALGGTSFAAVTLAKNSVLSKHIKNGQVKSADLGANAVSSSKVGDGSLLAQDFAAGQLPAGPQGPQGVQGPVGPSTGAAGGDLTGSYPNPTIADGAVTPAKLQAPGGFTSAGLSSAEPSCSSVTPNTWGTLSPAVNNTVSYYRDPYGTVHLRGIAVRCGTATDTVFTFPAGYRPGGQEVQLALFSTGSGRFDVNPDGTVVAAAVSTGAWISLDGHFFRCAPSGTGGCP